MILLLYTYKNVNIQKSIIIYQSRIPFSVDKGILFDLLFSDVTNHLSSDKWRISVAKSNWL